MIRALELALVVVIAFAAVQVARGATPPPRHAYPAAGAALRQRRALEYFAEGCFHVAPREWVCPLPAPPPR